MVEGLVLLGTVAASLAVMFAVRWLWPHWPRRRISVVSAAVLPGSAIAYCSYVAVDIALTPSERCGTDACAMAMAGVVMIVGISIVAYFLLLALAEAVQSGLDRR